MLSAEIAVRHRWDELMANVASLIPAGSASVQVDGEGQQPAAVAGRLAATLNASGRPCFLPPAAGHRIVLADGAGQERGRRRDVVIWLRAAGHGMRGGEAEADIVIDLHDPDWPVIRRVAAPLAGSRQWYIAETRAFFAPRAATWDTKFGDDLAAYAAAIAEAGLPRGGVALDIGCGTGRALPALREAVGPHGTVIAADLTPEMLRQACLHGRAENAALVLADARHLPLADASVDAIFAAGLITHLPDPEEGLRQLARVTRPGGLLILFHPSGRAALAARHGRTLTPDEPLAATPLERLTRATGWSLTTYDDAAERFLAIATRLSTAQEFLKAEEDETSLRR
jgi:ubiquinone/menaquinone biosynthesis C-methylase UbiE